MRDGTDHGEDNSQTVETPRQIVCGARLFLSCIRNGHDAAGQMHRYLKTEAAGEAIAAE